MNVIVTDCDTRLGYTISRALHRAGYIVHGVSACSTPRYSSIFSSVTKFPSILDGKDWIHQLDQTFIDGGVVFPISMEAIEYTLNNRVSFPERFILPRVSLEQFTIAKDKLLAADICAKIGVPTPKTWHSKTENIRYPCIVKRTSEIGYRPEERYEILFTPRQLLSSNLAHAKNVFFQEVVRGPGIGVGVCAEEGKILASFTHRRLREEIPTGGPSTFCESYKCDEVVEYSARIIKQLRWTGLAMIEFKQDEESGRHYFLEVNPRAWGSIQLPYECGLNFASLYVQLVAGLPPIVPACRVNKRRLKLVRLDVRAALRELRSQTPRKRLAFIGNYAREYTDSACKYEFSIYDLYKLSLAAERKFVAFCKFPRKLEKT